MITKYDLNKVLGWVEKKERLQRIQEAIWEDHYFELVKKTPPITTSNPLFEVTEDTDWIHNNYTSVGYYAKKAADDVIELRIKELDEYIKKYVED